MGELVDRRVDERIVPFEVAVVDEYLCILGLVESVDLEAFLARKCDGEVRDIAVELEKQRFYLVLINSFESFPSSVFFCTP